MSVNIDCRQWCKQLLSYRTASAERTLQSELWEGWVGNAVIWMCTGSHIYWTERTKCLIYQKKAGSSEAAPRKWAVNVFHSTRRSIAHALAWHQYTAWEVRETKNTARRVNRQAAKSTGFVNSLSHFTVWGASSSAMLMRQMEAIWKH